ncbi:hypothetical protein V498_01619 [Pseudogymnoascus sp. VKM F-4517 (FW-2822)]|nr:hypothetical protein V498_01619 [Pseudogymnoascus sp. VKM F-4517 (FW-2822)]
MSPQQQINRNGGGSTSGNAGPSMGSRFSLAILAAGPLGPPHYPLDEWSTNVSRGDNPVTDFLFKIIPVEKPTQKPRGDTTTRTI